MKKKYIDTGGIELTTATTPRRRLTERSTAYS